MENSDYYHVGPYNPVAVLCSAQEAEDWKDQGDFRYLVELELVNRSVSVEDILSSPVNRGFVKSVAGELLKD